MRVKTFHRKRVRRSSRLLGGLMTMHLFFSVPLTTILFFFHAGVRWRRDMLGTGGKAWTMVVLIAWFVVELVRLWLGFAANKLMLFPQLITFIVLTIIPQLALIVVYFIMTNQPTDVEYCICICQIILLILEFLVSIRHVFRLGRHNVIDFYVSNGFVFSAEEQRQRMQGAQLQLPIPSGSFAGTLLSSRHT